MFKKLSLFSILFTALSSFCIANGVADIQLTEIPKDIYEKNMGDGGCTYALPLKNNKMGTTVALEGMSGDGLLFGINNKIYKVKSRDWDGYTLSGNVYGKNFTIKRSKTLKGEHEYLRSISFLNFYEGKKVVRTIKLIEECSH